MSFLLLLLLIDRGCCFLLLLLLLMLLLLPLLPLLLRLLFWRGRACARKPSTNELLADLSLEARNQK